MNPHDDKSSEPRDEEQLASVLKISETDAPPPDRAEDHETWVRDRELQRVLWDGGFAGICFPSDYGGLGLTVEHQIALNHVTNVVKVFESDDTTWGGAEHFRQFMGQVR